MLQTFFVREADQSLIEYAVILMLIALVVASALTLVGRELSQAVMTISSDLSS